MDWTARYRDLDDSALLSLVGLLQRDDSVVSGTDLHARLRWLWNVELPRRGLLPARVGEGLENHADAPAATATLSFEDLTPGRVFDLGTVSVDRDEMLAFAHRFDPQPFHLDEEAGRQSLLGGLCASGWFTASLWMRGYADHVLAGSTAQGSPGGSELTWKAPVFPGDTLRLAATITGQRRSRSKPRLGLVDVLGTVSRDDTDVMRFAFLGMFGARELV